MPCGHTLASGTAPSGPRRAPVFCCPSWQAPPASERPRDLPHPPGPAPETGGPASPADHGVHDLRHSFAIHTLGGLVPRGIASMSREVSRVCRPTWATPAPLRRTGTCRQRPNSWGWRPSALAARWTSCHEATVAPLLEAFFTDRLLTQKQASTRTVRAYRDALSSCCLNFAKARTGKAPSDLLLSDLDAAFIGEFLTYLETERVNSIRTRNARLAAIRSFFRLPRPSGTCTRRPYPACPGHSRRSGSSATSSRS